MTMTDLVADMLTRIRNAASNKSAAVEVIQSKLNLAIAKDRLIEGLSERQIAAKRRTTVYRVRKGLLKIRLLLDGQLKTEEE